MSGSYCTLTNNLIEQIMMHECNDCIHDLDLFKSQIVEQHNANFAPNKYMNANILHLVV